VDLQRIATCLLAIVLAGCAGPGATASGLATATASAAASTASHGSRASLEASPSVAEPPAMPDGFPLHDSMEQVEAPPGATAAWTSSAIPPDVYAYYLEALPAAGFEIDLEAPGGTVAILRFHASNGTRYQLDMNGTDPIAITLGPPHQ
jgi:hypothetical protein